MRSTSSVSKWATRLLLTGVSIAGIAAAGAAQADSCREWTQEHWAIKSDIVRLYLKGAGQETLDGAVFELLQREAYMTSCDPSSVIQPTHQVGWRLLDRDPDEYAGAVMEALLADAGIAPKLAGLFASGELESPPPIATPSVVRGPVGHSKNRR